MQAYFRKTILPDSYFYLMIPIICAFRNYSTKTRQKYIVSFYITLIEDTYTKIAPKINDRDEREYEKYIRNILMGLEAIAEGID